MGHHVILALKFPEILFFLCRKEMFSLFTWFMFIYQYEILIENTKEPTKQNKVMVMVQNGHYV